jgi:DNA (cytosine-5)-methyltransferase 1
VRELHLFAGAGGGILGGMLLGHVPVCAVEIDPYCRQVLAERQADGNLPTFPVFEDVRKFDGTPWRGKVDVVCGGYPCQPWSSAGKRKGVNDERHLWPEMARIIGEVRPRYVFAENVSLPALEGPWRDLRRMGYRVPPALCLSAADVGAPHLRKRWWLLATDANRNREPVVAINDEAPVLPQTGNANNSRLEKRQGKRSDPCKRLEAAIGASWWATEPDIPRVDDGVANRVVRLRALGNGQVPQCAAEAWRILMAQNEAVR